MIKTSYILTAQPKNLTVWLNANKISLNVQETEQESFTQKREILDHEIKIKLNTRRLYPIPNVKILGEKIDEDLNWHHHMYDLADKLNGENALLSKIRNYVNQKVLRSIYFDIFDSRLNYTNQNNIVSASKLSFKSIFFQKNNIQKSSDKTMIENILFIFKVLNNMLPLIFKNWFQFCYNIHHYSTTSSVKGYLHKKSFRRNNFGKFFVTVSAIDSWNKMQDQMDEIALKDLRSSKIKWLPTDKFIKSY